MSDATSSSRPCHICQGPATVRIDAYLPMFHGGEISIFFCKDCRISQAKVQPSNRRLKRRGFESHRVLWTRTDETGGAVSERLDQEENSQVWNAPPRPLATVSTLPLDVRRDR